MTYPPSSGSPYGATPCTKDPYVATPNRPATPPASEGVKGPLILLFIGAGLCVAAVVVLIVLVTSATRTAADIRPIEANGSTTVSLESATPYGLYGNGGSRCEVVGPDGAELDVTVPMSTITVNDRILFGQVTAQTSGEHTITCFTGAGTEGVYFGPPVDAKSIVRSVFGVFAVVGMFITGIPLTIGGIIGLVVRNSNNPRARRTWAAAPPAGSGGGAPGTAPEFRRSPDFPATN
ncbi:hypothetical protein [Actinomyces sp.]|uniref:hypothetical protein n=1 Tax=Actinomyces sp. TaxID=29317 RepID=UPI0026DDA97C|nr:hypothetical protein [Actinomyces sp.]MDO4901811.1 hypothetical protein [Actinomyces sp.]